MKPAPWLFRAGFAFGCLVLLPECGGPGGSTGPTDSPSMVPCVLPNYRCWEEVPIGFGFVLPVYRTHPLGETDAGVRRLVIVVHGANRDPDYYFETMVLATTQAGVLDETLVIAPHFQTASDGPGPGQPTWTSNGWKRGDPSTNSMAGVRVSSYGAIDRIIEALGDGSHFPNLEKVVVTGHSAGGQYTHRFSAGSRVEDDVPELRFRYIVANPSTYLYLGPERAGQDGGAFGLPDREACPDYDQWHYGLEELNPYMLEMTIQQAQDQMVRRDIVYLVGDEDTGGSMLDVSCGGMLQGPNRYLRGLTLYLYMSAFFPENGHRLFEIPGVGHSSRGVYTSQRGREVLFGW